ncbi:MAG: ABC transporter ATP-binding protein [Candidatus Peribacteraceae bacterium]|nr:ABC transporter ATP-binding protein [Candidatus Peribacteraceae bacterium]
MTKKESAPLIETKGLFKSYFNEAVETPVLFDINLRINAGEFVAIMGPSGSGKSTLMHILGFLDVPTTGRYYFKGEPTEEKSEDELARIRSASVSFVFQSFNLLPRTSVIDNVTLPLLYHSGVQPAERREHAMKAIKAVGLTDRATYLSNQLSGGQQQRVAIARALVTEPGVIFADEPTGNLDSASGKQVMEILQNLHDAGHTIILVTHEKTTAEHAARIIRIMDGRIVADDTAFERRIAKQLKELK